MGKPSHVVDDDLMMTIASDEELSQVEESSDEETEDKELKDAIISKKQAKKEAKQAKKARDISDDFEFDEDGAFAGPTGCSWDFTKAITRIEALEGSSLTRRTTIQSKIEKRRQEIAKAKQEKKEKKKAAKKSNSDSDEEDNDEEASGDEADVAEEDKVEEANTDDDEDDEEEEEEEEEEQGDNDGDEAMASAGEEEEEDEKDSDEGSSDEEDDEEDDTVVEEARLQSALKDDMKNKTARERHEEELERKKAAEFFESDPFAAEEFAKTKFETFADLKLSRPIMRAITQLGFEKPTPIQQRAVPVALTGKDICASAQTGSGKTAAFLLPILERLQFRSRRVQATRVLIICPVRELATQCQSMLEQLARYTDITCSLAVGGLPLQAQEVELRNRPDVVICTPGRMIDHLRNSKSIHMDDLEILVLDEADRLLELGFMEEVMELVRMCPVTRQTMLFSATLTSKIDQLIELSMKRPVRISTDPLFDMAKHLVQEFVRIRPQREGDRDAILLALCTRTFRTNTIVFMETKVHAHRMMIVFGLAGIKAAELHGNLSQKERLEALQNFRDGKVDILLCTDIAARGIDVRGVHAVINYEMPKDITTYVHRVGRTARAGRNGRAVTLTSESRRLIMKQVVRHCHGFVKSRAVPDAVIAQWNARIEGMADDIQAIMKEETMERRLREAEKEATRAQNMLVHQDEISARPARTWFLTEKEKKKVAERAEAERQAHLTKTGQGKDGDNADDKADTMSRAKKLKLMSRKKRRLFELRESEQHALDDARRAAEEAEEAGEAPRKGKKVFTSLHVAAAAKHAKKDKMREAAEREEESIAEMHERKRQKRALDQQKARDKAATKAAKAKASGFDVDLSDPSAKRKPATDAKPKSNGAKNPFEFKEKITSYKKHAKKGVSSFKSKGRYRRRK
ncbi:TPA: hypothetical protein N0F65_007747 [Lagenidium giganteum]|uniref:DEAD/DEAH box RNA helicase n=1 Tax=Lagenidium giganteum TaxID=4803 RepID=A0AAV2Z5J0_9STRA|nr:TPA: hypothetical protein N0F65_007747 [Lagenidium giganteum]